MEVDIHSLGPWYQPIHAASTISQALRHSLHAFAATAIGQVAAKNPNPHGHLGDAPRRYQLERDRGGVSRASGLTPNLLPSHTLCSLFTVSAWHRRLSASYLRQARDDMDMTSHIASLPLLFLSLSLSPSSIPACYQSMPIYSPSLLQMQQCHIPTRARPLCSALLCSALFTASPSLDARVFLGPGEHGHENLRLDVHCRNGGYRRASSTDPQPGRDATTHAP